MNLLSPSAPLLDTEHDPPYKVTAQASFSDYRENWDTTDEAGMRKFAPQEMNCMSNVFGQYNHDEASEEGVLDLAKRGEASPVDSLMLDEFQMKKDEDEEVFQTTETYENLHRGVEDLNITSHTEEVENWRLLLRIQKIERVVGQLRCDTATKLEEALRDTASVPGLVPQKSRRCCKSQSACEMLGREVVELQKRLEQQSKKHETQLAEYKRRVSFLELQLAVQESASGQSLNHFVLN